MKQFEIDKLVDEIQDYLNSVETDEEDATAVGAMPDNHEKAGLFIPEGSKKKMGRFLKTAKYAGYAIETLAIGLLTTVIMAPFGSWPRTVMFVIGTLLVSIFAVAVLHAMQARIRLLLQIEANTQRIAVSKVRIAMALEKFRLE